MALRSLSWETHVRRVVQHTGEANNFPLVFGLASAISEILDLGDGLLNSARHVE